MLHQRCSLPIGLRSYVEALQLGWTIECTLRYPTANFGHFILSERSARKHHITVSPKCCDHPFHEGNHKNWLRILGLLSLAETRDPIFSDNTTQPVHDRWHLFTVSFVSTVWAYDQLAQYLPSSILYRCLQSEIQWSTRYVCQVFNGVLNQHEKRCVVMHCAWVSAMLSRLIHQRQMTNLPDFVINWAQLERFAGLSFDLLSVRQLFSQLPRLFTDSTTAVQQFESATRQVLKVIGADFSIHFVQKGDRYYWQETSFMTTSQAGYN